MPDTELSSSATPPAPVTWPAGIKAAAFLTGRPSRAEALATLIERMKALPGLWITTVGELAAHTMSLGLPPRSCPQPQLPSDAYWVTAEERTP